MLRQKVSVKFIFQHSKKNKTGPLGLTVQELLKFENGNLFGTPFRKDECFEISDLCNPSFHILLQPNIDKSDF